MQAEVDSIFQSTAGVGSIFRPITEVGSFFPPAPEVGSTVVKRKITLDYFSFILS